MGSQTSRLSDLRIAPRKNGRLCNDCQYWNNTQDVFAYMQAQPVRTTSLESMLQQHGCMICRVISSAVQAKVKCLSWPMTDSRDVQIHVGTAFEVFRQEMQAGTTTMKFTTASERLKVPPKCIKCVLYLDIYNQREAPQTGLKKRTWRWWSAPTLGLQLLLEYDGNPIRLAKANVWDERYFDIKEMKRWISNCESQHGSECQKSITKGLPAHFKLINIDELCIVDASESQRFVAFSYMWTVHGSGKDLQLMQSNVGQLSQPGRLELHQVPELIFDAIILCRELGEKWLWIDRLGIVQDDPVIKGVQISAMDTIYRIAAFTLVAAVDTAKAIGLPGVRGRPRASFLENETRLYHYEGCNIDLNFFVTVDKSAWNTRGWTFQERVLSTRCIYITNYQTYFTCPQALVQEEVGEFSRKNRYNIGPPGHLGVPSVHDLITEHSYLDYVRNYTARILSYESDIERAFTGVSNVLAAEMRTSFLFCLPEKYFTTALLWHSIAHPTMRRKDAVEIPSWSWAGWSGAINYEGPFSMDVMATDIGTLVAFHIQNLDRSLRRLNADDGWFGQHINFSHEILEETRHRYIPDPKITEEVWRKCPHNPWEARNHLTLSQLACQTAMKYPGSLVFNTTTAVLSLRPNAASNEDPDTISLDICSPFQGKIGNIQIDRAWMDAKVNLKQEQIFIVLCAGILPKSKRRDLHVAQIFNLEDHDKTPWLLIVMMVQQRKGVSERLGIGYIEARLWDRANPVWETIILV